MLALHQAGGWAGPAGAGGGQALEQGQQRPQASHVLRKLLQRQHRQQLQSAQTQATERTTASGKAVRTSTELGEQAGFLFTHRYSTKLEVRLDYPPRGSSGTSGTPRRHRLRGRTERDQQRWAKQGSTSTAVAARPSSEQPSLRRTSDNQFLGHARLREPAKGLRNRTGSEMSGRGWKFGIL